MDNRNISRDSPYFFLGKEYHQLHSTNKRKREKLFIHVLLLFYISEEDALAVLCKNILSRAENRDNQLEPGADFKIFLGGNNVPLPLSKKMLLL